MARSREEDMTLDFTPEQKMVRDTVRQWVERELEPRVLAIERGELSPFVVMREMAEAFGLPDLARSRFGKMEKRASAGAPGKQAGDATMGDPAFGMILACELARSCPGYLLSFGATLGLAGGAIMAR